MIVHDVAQGSTEWINLRLGVVTASCFSQLVTPGKYLPAKGTAYLNRLVAERHLGRPMDEEDTAFMERGRELEPEARDQYAWVRGVDPTLVGFITTDDGRVGCSPDALVGDDGIAEFKCPSAVVHAGYFLEPDALRDKYWAQAQGLLYVTRRAWVDLFAYNPGFPDVLVRVEPDAGYFAALDKAVPAFLARLDAAMARLSAEDPSYVTTSTGERVRSPI